MKKIMTIAFASALLLTGCGQIDEDTGTKVSDTDLQSSIADSKAVLEIMVRETGGEDGVTNEWHIFQSEYYNIVTKADLLYPDFPDTYHISDDDYKDIITLDFSDYIGKNDALYKEESDWLNCYVEISYDDETTDISQVYIPELWNKLHGIVYNYNPIETVLPKDGDSSDDEHFAESRAVGEYEYIDISDNEPLEDIGEAYYKEVSEEDILFDEEHGIKYARNQLLISVFPETDKIEVKKIADEFEADIVGVIELTGDYQIEFRNDKTLNQLDETADYINSYPFVMNVTLNIISEATFADATNAEEENDNVNPISKE